MSEGDGNFLKARQEAKKGELDEQLREYINEWRKQRSKEEEELKRLKEKQSKRKEIRAEQEKKLAQQKKEEEERIRNIESEKKAKEAEEKRKRLEEAEKKRQMMMQAQKDKQNAAGGAAAGGKRSDGGMGSVGDARREMTKTKEQLEEEKKISLSIRIKPLELDGMYADALKDKAGELWETIVRLETEKYDLQERQKRQDYDLKELKERQRQQNKQKAIKLGLDPEALTGKYPPKIRMYSKYERRTDTRTYEDRKNFTRAVGRFCTVNFWRRIGRRNLKISANMPRLSCQNGSERGQEERLDSQIRLRMMMNCQQMLLQLMMMTRSTMKRRRRRKKK
eukprot:TRINITY_DN4980_c1_g1_i2.p1 TRINITY_DN4980_c1_g1~~TRINITY_DN4980_c1_g1_i2.p1  ORF type:complete len:337 (-),score=118.06 TRINITY_DN4980_c1_g1_i2:41-1051(-)